MDVYKFQSTTSSTLMENGIFLNDIKSITWIERYRDAGEFTIVAPASSKLRKQLPIGSFISHVKTDEIMIVENHEINDNKGQDAEVTITGRSLETILDNRIVGNNKTLPMVGTPADYALNANYVADQAWTLIINHIGTSQAVNPDDGIPWIFSDNIYTVPGISIPRAVKRGSLYARVLELLEIDNLGIKITPPGVAHANTYVYLTIHGGTDRSSQVAFSYGAGEIESAGYLWSNRNYKNAAFIVTKWVQTFTYTSGAGYMRRTMLVDASDIDQDYTVAPTGGALGNVISAAQRRGLEALNAQKDINLTKAEVSKEAVKYVYRVDYNVGDIVTVIGDYNESSKMRVTEFVEIEDETGEYAYPTLTLEV